MDWAVARIAGLFWRRGLGLGGGAGGEVSTVVRPVFFFLPAFPRRAAGTGGGSANSSSWDRLTPGPAFAPARARVPLRDFARGPFVAFFRVPDRAFALPFTFAVFLRDAFAKGPPSSQNSAV
jgi:hypothetical protein